MPEDNSTRDRIRALVRDVLDKIPAEEVSAPAAASDSPPTRFIDTAPASTVAGAQPAVTRDESSKRGNHRRRCSRPGTRSSLALAEGARLTPLAADIVREKKSRLFVARRAAVQARRS